MECETVPINIFGCVRPLKYNETTYYTAVTREMFHGEAVPTARDRGPASESIRTHNMGTSVEFEDIYEPSNPPRSILAEYSGEQVTVSDMLSAIDSEWAEVCKAILSVERPFITKLHKLSSEEGEKPGFTLVTGKTILMFDSGKEKIISNSGIADKALMPMRERSAASVGNQDADAYFYHTCSVDKTLFTTDGDVVLTQEGGGERSPVERDFITQTYNHYNALEYLSMRMKEKGLPRKNLYGATSYVGESGAAIVAGSKCPGDVTDFIIAELAVGDIEAPKSRKDPWHIGLLLYRVLREMKRCYYSPSSKRKPNKLLVDNLSAVRWRLSRILSSGLEDNQEFYSDENLSITHLKGNSILQVADEEFSHLEELRDTFSMATSAVDPLATAETAEPLEIRVGDETRFNAEVKRLGKDKAWFRIAIAGNYAGALLAAAIPWAESGDPIAQELVYNSLSETEDYDLDQVYTEDEEVEHFARHKDSRDSIGGVKRVGGIRLISRKATSVGGSPVGPRTIRGKYYRLALKTLEGRISATLINIKNLAPGMFARLTGLQVLGFGFEKHSGNSWTVDPNVLANDLLQGKYGKKGFGWIVNTILYNGVFVDKRSRATCFLPRDKLRYSDSGLYISEPIVGGVRYLKTFYKKGKVFIDWGPELGAREIESTPQSTNYRIYHAKKTEENLEDARACTITGRIKLMGFYQGLFIMKREVAE